MSIEAAPLDVLLVLVTCPAAEADRLATGLVDARLAACVSQVPAVRSVYRWQGTVETASETQLLIKTPGDRFEAVRDFVRANHPYALPEILALPVQSGLPDYLQWIHTETR